MLQVKNYFEEKEDIYVKIGNEGVIMSIGDGIVKGGLRGVTAGEMVIMGNKSVKGMALNLEHNGGFGNDLDQKTNNIFKEDKGEIFYFKITCYNDTKLLDSLGVLINNP